MKLLSNKGTTFPFFHNPLLMCVAAILYFDRLSDYHDVSWQCHLRIEQPFSRSCNLLVLVSHEVENINK